jgi:hypothetical protein
MNSDKAKKLQCDPGLSPSLSLKVEDNPCVASASTMNPLFCFEFHLCAPVFICGEQN